MPLHPEIRERIFRKLRAGLKNQCPPMVCSRDEKGCYEIIGNKPVPYGSTGKIVPGMAFASVVPRKDMVSFYVMPVAYGRKEFEDVAPGLLKCLKGKSCFNFKVEDEIDSKELDALLGRGVTIWKKLGYMR